QVVVRLEADVAAATAVAAARAALGHVRLAMEGHAAFAAVTRLRINFDLINKHAVELKALNRHFPLVRPSSQCRTQRDPCRLGGAVNPWWPTARFAAGSVWFVRSFFIKFPHV